MLKQNAKDFFSQTNHKELSKRIINPSINIQCYGIEAEMGRLV